MSNSTSKNILSGYAYYLAERQLLERQAALNALQEASRNQVSYIEYLVENQLIDESQAASTTSEYFGLPLCDINVFKTDEIPTEFLNIQVVRKKLALPLFRKGGFLYLAVTDPTIEHLYEIKFLTGYDTRLIIVEMSKLQKAMNEFLNTLILSEIGDVGNEGVNVTVDSYKEESGADLAAYDVESAPVVNFVNKVLVDAIEKRASDIHFERYENNFRIRYRQNGILYPINAPPMKLANYLLARIKVMSNLDITEHRVPQDGRFKLILSKNKSVDFRVSICPTLFGEKVVLRILDASQTLQGVDQLGMDEIQLGAFKSSLKHSQGMILVTGPTGSGKTVTLYSALNLLNSSEKNISTVEDPVEIPIEGINQVHVNTKTGLTFAKALRSFLRQDPDIIMVGEIRDLETAEIGIKASQTGHLVLSTVHTNSAPETINRLINMGVAPYNLASSLTIVIAQRLVRILCEDCKQEQKISPETLMKEGFNLDEAERIRLYEAKGCDNCVQGFKGRTGIFEVMPISVELSELIMQGSNTIEIAKQAKNEGILTLRESGLEKVKKGITSLSELNRVFN